MFAAQQILDGEKTNHMRNTSNTPNQMKGLTNGLKSFFNLLSFLKEFFTK